ncbi:ABC transporter ATP-binding protein [Butyrivibrio sp. INlla16]|uniref:ABC transporter ATP-binding protein n=1 Tax=Butyrivibrio sp. INlla16 TaxID=1520807 RepID=UPI00088F4A05|nr:ABC transporter ATP-binding protein [Butyrivibrio sp. INlla16]SDB38705.1 ATP-binding cassette, subfamily B [Butyrivibrio sp. INlla16]
MRELKRVLKYASAYKLLIFLSISFAVISAVLTLYAPIIAGQVVDCIVGKGDVNFELIRSLLIRMGIVIGITALCQWFMYGVNNRITFSVIRDVRNDAFDKLQILPFEYLDSHPQGEVVSKVISDVDQFADGLLMGFTQLFTGIVTIAGTLVFMFYLQWKIAAMVVILTPISLLVARFIATRSYSLFKEQSKARAEQTALIDEMIGNLKVVKAFGHEDENQETFDEINERLAKTSLKATFFSSLTNPSTRVVNNTVYAFVALFGAFECINGIMSVGSLTIFLSYATQYTKPFNEISGVVTELQNALACARRVFDLIDEKPQIPDAVPCDELGIAKGNIEIKDVEFSYDKDRELIKNLTLSVKEGQRVAIVGPTGSGKTTIINLLMRFYDVDKGAISVEGCDIRNLRRAQLRENYGMVLQETWLRSGTIKDNITLGRTGFTEAEVIEAAKKSHAHSFIKKLPDGYDTVISEDGGMLSQGQKQLLCITRIMLSVPPMLILDEATSSIDTRTEMRIQRAFQKMMVGRTSFIVAHRLSTIKEADRILVMKDGHIIEQGDHNSLLKANGFYSDLYRSQFEQ